MSLAPLKYLTIYPFLPLTIAKLFCLASSALSLILFFKQSEFNIERAGFITAICDLLAILAISNSLWFTVQKFYWKKLDVALSASAFIFYLISSICLVAMLNPSRLKMGSVFYCILLLHCYLLLSTGFCCVWSLCWTANTVSTLLIAQWGASTTDDEIEFFGQDPG